MKSIMQEKDGRCYLCMKLNNDYSQKYVEEHHCLNGTANRKLSTLWGLTVYLCLDHHTNGQLAVHNNQDMMRIVKQDAQRAFEKKWPDEDFRGIFGKNYL